MDSARAGIRHPKPWATSCLSAAGAAADNRREAVRSGGSAMKRLATAAVAAVCVGIPVHAQPSAAPQVLPTTIIDPASARPAGPLSPAEAAKQRDALIAALKEDLRSIDP